jgi:sugar phosphate isomerase/epimerase
MVSETIALQLYTLRHQTASDFAGTLAEVANAGYVGVEFAGLGSFSAAQMRGMLDELGIAAVSAHVPHRRFVAEPDAVIAELHQLGCAYAVVPGVPEELRADGDAIRALASSFNAWGEACSAAGLAFGYHNHSWEFEPLAGGTKYDLLAAETDPALVHLQIDIYWAQFAGADSAALLRRYAGRVPTLHAKEMSAAPDRRDSTVGDGITPWETLIPVATEAGTKVYIVEQEDDPDRAFRDIARNRVNLEHFLAAHGAAEL